MYNNVAGFSNCDCAIIIPMSYYWILKLRAWDSEYFQLEVAQKDRTKLKIYSLITQKNRSRECEQNAQRK